jgi:hypothetical protein
MTQSGHRAQNNFSLPVSPLTIADILAVVRQRERGGHALLSPN